MRKSNITKSRIIFICLILFLLSCETKQQDTVNIPEPAVEIPDDSPVQEEPEVEIVSEESVIIIEEPAVIIEESAIVSEPEPALVTETEPPKDEEYTRSVSELKDEVIPPDVFETDKKTILKIIDDLADIMVKKNYKRWIKYISPQSLTYWQNSSNLEAVSSRLPVKGLVLKNLEDYFKLIFIPSRLNVTVDEIRYISSTSVKVVQVRGDQDIICYYFEKIKGEWMLILDTM